jgi:hypothetical protein
LGRRETVMQPYAGAADVHGSRGYQDTDWRASNLVIDLAGPRPSLPQSTSTPAGPQAVSPTCGAVVRAGPATTRSGGVEVLQLGRCPTRRSSRSTLSACPPLEARQHASSVRQTATALTPRSGNTRLASVIHSPRRARVPTCIPTRIRISSIPIIRGRESRFLVVPLHRK